MTNQKHPIIPPPKVLQQWMTEFYGAPVVPGEASTDLATRAAQWGADQELEACCEWLVAHQWHGPSGACLVNLRANRRPKPPSLKEQAYAAIDRIERSGYPTDDLYTLRRVLEVLPE